MWSFVETLRIENEWGRWAALVALRRDDAPAEGFWVYFDFDTEPDGAAADAAGIALAERFNAQAG